MGSVPNPSAMYDEDVDNEILFEPIAVVGMAFKFPQEATTEKGFWAILQGKRNVMTEWPKDRINIDAFYHPDGNRKDTVRALLHESG